MPGAVLMSARPLLNRRFSLRTTCGSCCGRFAARVASLSMTRPNIMQLNLEIFEHIRILLLVHQILLFENLFNFVFSHRFAPGHQPLLG